VRIAGPNSLHDLILERPALGIVLLEPSFRSVDICEHLEMIGVADLFAGIDVGLSPASAVPNGGLCDPD
jgi:hypothetical protein